MQKIDPPSKEILEDLLFNQLLSKKRIATLYSVCKNVVTRWMREYDLVNKTTISLQQQKRNRNKQLSHSTQPGDLVEIPGFNSDFLEEYRADIDRRRARKEQLATDKMNLKLRKLHPSIPKEKFPVSREHIPGCIPPKTQLENYLFEQNKTQKELSIIYHVTATTINRWIKHYHIQLKPKKGSRFTGKTIPKRVNLVKTRKIQKLKGERA